MGIRSIACISAVCLLIRSQDLRISLAACSFTVRPIEIRRLDRPLKVSRIACLSIEL